MTQFISKLILILSISFITDALIAQNNDIPSVEIKTLNNERINTKEILGSSELTIVSFWATWCKPCIKELDAYNENIVDWTEETGVNLIAISTDNARSMNRVAPFVNGRGWDNIIVYLDPNEDLKRAFNVINVPHTLLINNKGEILWQHTSYSEGDEYELYEAIVKHANKTE